MTERKEHLQKHEKSRHSNRKVVLEKIEAVDYNHDLEMDHMDDGSILMEENMEEGSLEKINNEDNTSTNTARMKKRVKRVRIFACKHCDYKTSHKPHLKGHIKGVHENRNMLACQQCDYSTERKILLQKHEKSMHKDMQDGGSNQLACEYCDYTTERKDDLNKHRNSTHKCRCGSLAECLLRCPDFGSGGQLRLSGTQEQGRLGEAQEAEAAILGDGESIFGL